MVYLFIMTVFSLFIGLNDVYASDYYYIVDDEKYTLEKAKAFYNKYQSYTNGDVTYDLTKYDYVAYDVSEWVAFSDYDLYFNHFGSSYYVSASFNSHDTSNEFIFKNDYFKPLTTSGFFTTSLLYYTRGIKVPISSSYFVKFKTSLCPNAGSFCSHSVGTDGDYTIVPISDDNHNLYGFLNLAQDEKKAVDYTVNIYLDDVVSSSYTESSFVGETVSLKGLDSDKLRADENNKYEVVLTAENNVFELRYYTSTYGTVNQQIHTDNTELPIPFSYDKLKEMFPDVNFELWTSYEQFNFVLMFNLFFVLFMFFIVFILFRIFYFIKGWFF